MTTLRARAFLPAILGVAALAAGGERQPADYVPADAFLAVTYDGAHPGLEETRLHAFFQEPEVRQAARRLRPLLDRLVDWMGREAGMDVAPAIRAGLRSQVAVGFLKPAEGKEPDVVVAFHVGEAGAEARREAERLLAAVVQKAGEGNVRQLQVGGVTATALKTGEEEKFLFAFHGPFLVRAGREAVLGRALDEGQPKLAGKLGDQRPVFRIRYDHEALVEAFGDEMGGRAREVLAALGLDALRSGEIAVLPRGKRMVTRLDVDLSARDERVGIAGWLADAPPLDRELLRRVPAESQIFFITMADLPGTWDRTWATVGRVDAEAREKGLAAVAKAEEVIGLKFRDDLLAHFQRGTVVVMAAGRGLFGGYNAVVQKVDDPKALDTKLGQVVARLEGYLMGKMAAEGPVRLELRKFDYRGFPCRYVWLFGKPALFFFGTAPCYAVLDDAIVFSGHPVHLKSYLDFLADEGPSIAENEEFGRLAEALPRNAASVSYGSLTDTLVAFYNSLAPFAMTFQGFGEQLGLEQAPDLAALPSSRLIERYCGPGLGFSVFEDGHYRYQMEGEGLTFLGPQMAPAATLGVLAGMLVPALTRARTEARLALDKNHLHQIAVACAMHLNEHGTYPSGLQELVEKEMLPKGVLVCPLDEEPPELPDGTPCSYVSCFQKYPDRVFLDAFPPDAMMAWDREPFVEGRRSVVFFDSHVETVAEPRFQQLLEQLDKLVKEEGNTRKRGPGPADF
ncbi:MAG: hypothetical protein ACLF0G_09730 [Candidatus Brocadiia bacterium]